MFISQNYGKGQQKLIRQSIRSHAADLLEYRKDIQRVDWEFQNETGTKVVPVNPGVGKDSKPTDDVSSVSHEQELQQAAQSSDVR